MTVPFWKIPNVAWAEIGYFRVARRRHHGHAAAPGNNVSPLGSDRVPVQLAQGTRLEAHRHGGEARRYGKLVYSVLHRRARRTTPAFRTLEVEFEVRKIAHAALF